MSFLAGQRVTAGQLNRVQPTSYLAAATGPLAVATSTYADIPGATVTFTTQAFGAQYTAWGVFDASVTTTSASILMLGHLQVDGVTDTGVAVHGMAVANRDTVAMMWQGTLGAAGSHTLSLQGALSGALASGGTFLQQDTKLTVTITEVV